MFLITGCGRSGTLYMAKCLRRGGLDVGHEEIGTDGAVSSVWCAPQPPYPSYHQQGPRPKFDVVLHQVRHPLPTIGSVTTSSWQSWRFNQIWTPIDSNWHVVKRAAYYWFYWNERAERQAELTYCIENLENVWEEIGARIDHDAPYDVTRDIPRDTNARPHPELDWSHVEKYAPKLYIPIQQKAKRYGYEEGL